MIKGRDARKDDIKAIVALDRKAYGKFGGNKGYFLKKLGSQKIIVAEQNKRIVGLEKDVNQFVGKSAVIGSLFGFIGAVILTIIGWLLTKIKL